MRSADGHHTFASGLSGRFFGRQAYAADIMFEDMFVKGTYQSLPVEFPAFPECADATLPPSIKAAGAMVE